MQTLLTVAPTLQCGSFGWEQQRHFFPNKHYERPQNINGDKPSLAARRISRQDYHENIKFSTKIKLTFLLLDVANKTK